MSKTFFEQKIREQAKLASNEPRDHEFALVERFTIGTLIKAILAIDCDADAQAFFQGYTAWLGEHQSKDADSVPAQVACANIGWCFGEGMSRERIAMWRRTTPAAHPVLPITEDYQPTAEECLDAGLRAGRKLKRGKA